MHCFLKICCLFAHIGPPMASVSLRACPSPGRPERPDLAGLLPRRAARPAEAHTVRHRADELLVLAGGVGQVQAERPRPPVQPHAQRVRHAPRTRPAGHATRHVCVTPHVTPVSRHTWAGRSAAVPGGWRGQSVSGARGPPETAHDSDRASKPPTCAPPCPSTDRTAAVSTSDQPREFCHFLRSII